jgi:hypothetical protein
VLTKTSAIESEKELKSKPDRSPSTPFIVPLINSIEFVFKLIPSSSLSPA